MANWDTVLTYETLIFFVDSQLPNFTTYELNMDDDDDEELDAVAVRYVPLHPVDLANYLLHHTPPRVYYRRRIGNK